MKIARQFVSFVLGIAVSACLYSFYKLRPLLERQHATLPQAGAKPGGRSFRSLLAPRDQPPSVLGKLRAVIPVKPARPPEIVASAEASRASGHLPVAPRVEHVRPAPGSAHTQVVQPAISSHHTTPARDDLTSYGAAKQLDKAKIAETDDPAVQQAADLPLARRGPSSSGTKSATPPNDSKPVAPASVSLPSLPAVVFTPIGYVEKSPGHVEAIIVQEDEPQVVHKGDLISGRYRVTDISPNSVTTADEGATTTMAATASKHARDSLGYIQEPNGEVEDIMADGGTIRLVPETSDSTLALAEAIGHSPNPTPIGASRPPKPTNDSAASVEVPQGRSARHESPSSAGRKSTAILAAAPGLQNTESVAISARVSPGIRESPVTLRATNMHPTDGAPPKPLASAAAHASANVAKSPAPATFIFQTLGYVETAHEGHRAIVADGSQVYIVSPGDTFGGQYQATSVDASFVLAVKAPSGPGSSRPDHTDSGGKSASNSLYGYLHFSLAALANAPADQQVDASDATTLLNFNLLNSSYKWF